jgi:hypothetical protein
MTNKDFPFDQICDAVLEQSRKRGHFCYQKFTCSGCGARLTMDQPNIIFETGTCDKCPAITDIKKQGCNYMLQIKLGAK